MTERRVTMIPKDLCPALSIVGGVAIEEIEAWILALLGARGSEAHADGKAVLAHNHGITTRAAKVEAVEEADFTIVADDAASLHDWLARGRAALQG